MPMESTAPNTRRPSPRGRSSTAGTGTAASITRLHFVRVRSTVSNTVVLHEIYICMVGDQDGVRFDSRASDMRPSRGAASAGSRTPVATAGPEAAGAPVPVRCLPVRGTAPAQPVVGIQPGDAAPHVRGVPQHHFGTPSTIRDACNGNVNEVSRQRLSRLTQRIGLYHFVFVFVVVGEESRARYREAARNGRGRTGRMRCDGFPI